MALKWNIAAECISTVMLLIIWNYSRRGAGLPTFRNRIFQACFCVNFCAMVSNILSTELLAYPYYASAPLIWLVTLVYFVATPLMGLCYFGYAAAVIYEKRQHSKMIYWCLLPGAIYLILVVLNPATKWLFDIDADGAYTRGPLIIITYLVFYIYCVFAVVLVMYRRKWIDRQVASILAAFPVVAGTVIVFQQVFSDIILSGSAATCALLIIYLYLQNKQISMDYLTKLPNRLEFLTMLGLLFQRRAEHPFSVLVLSLRDFKQINDTFGQQNGDLFLQGVADYLRGLTQRNCLYRFSGDEFAVVVDGREALAEELIQQIRTRMTHPWQAQEISCVLGSSIGVARYPGCADTVEGLVHGLEYAVSQAKQSRGDSVCYCGPEMLKVLQRRTQIVEILKERLRSNSFELYYQPILSVKTRRFVLAESLLRIPDSPLGPIYPDEFIPIAEESGMIVEMTYQILDQVCKFVNRLTEEGVELEGVHVNFSAVQFTQRNLEERVTEIVRRNNTPFSKIKIEITESVLAENNSAVEQFAEQMHRRGVLLGLDDFGTGYSNIASVLDTPLDIIKIDKSMLWSAMENKRSAIMIPYLAGVFHEMGLTVLVEGVETPEQDVFCRACGIDLIQGYLYARPMEEEDAVRLLKLGAVN